MKTRYAACLVLAVSLATEAAEDDRTPDEQYRECLKAYSAASRDIRGAKTDLQRKRAVEELDRFPKEFVDLAETNSSHPVALQALRQAVQAVVSVDSQANLSAEINRKVFPAGSQGDSVSRIVKALLRNHIKSDKLGPICDRMRWSVRTQFQQFLRAALEKNPHRNVQGMACLALAQLRHNHLRMLDLATDRPELIERYDALYGEGYVRRIRGAGRSSLVRQIESLYQRATKFDDVVNLPFRGSVAEKARSELYSLRHLSRGKAAPEIVGVDQQGRRLKLSDYRGQVVLLYFWQEY